MVEAPSLFPCVTLSGGADESPVFAAGNTPLSVKKYTPKQGLPIKLFVIE